MKKILYVLYFGLIITLLISCNKASLPRTLNEIITTNPSTNAAWGSKMCESEGMVYFISMSNNDGNRKYHIMRMNADGSEQTQVTENYPYIGGLVSDGKYVYFSANALVSYEGADKIYCLSTDDRPIREVANGYINNLQFANDRLYWKDCPQTPSGEIKRGDTKPLAIKSVNPDGSDMQILFSMNIPLDVYKFIFLATEKGLFYCHEGSNYNLSNLYQMDFDGQNVVKINKSELNDVHKVFYDSGNLYLVMGKDGWDFDFRDYVVTIDENGKLKMVIGDIGYFPQDFSTILYCGISDGMFYYFDDLNSSGSSTSLLPNLHQYDLNTKRDSIVKYNIEMGDKSAGTLQSVRGKSIPVKGLSGLYIVGNDIYFSTVALP